MSGVRLILGETNMSSGRTAVVTGASGGLGLAICRALASNGTRIVALDQTEDKVHEAVRLLAESGHPNAIGVVVDIASSESVAAAFSEIDANGLVPDILVNNAGIREIKSIIDLEPSEWDRVVAVNLNGPYYCSREAALRMRKNGGSIVNISSVAGLVGIRNRPAYCATKHGLVGLTRNLAFDLASCRIRVNAIAPGAIPTPMTAAYYQDEHFLKGLEHAVALGNSGTPEAIADATVFLCSDYAKFITGIVLPVDGGFMAEKSFAMDDAPSFRSAANSTSC